MADVHIFIAPGALLLTSGADISLDDVIWLTEWATRYVSPGAEYAALSNTAEALGCCQYRDGAPEPGAALPLRDAVAACAAAFAEDRLTAEVTLQPTPLAHEWTTTFDYHPGDNVRERARAAVRAIQQMVDEN